MAKKTKIRKIGNSYGIVLPKETLHILKVKEGDTLIITDGPECSVRLTSDQDHFEEMMKLADSVMHRYQNALRKLAE